MDIKAYVCPLCGDKLYSRARHDFRRCSCGSMFVDGGLELYTRIGFPDGMLKYIKIETIRLLGVTEEVLYNDWNKGIDRFGLIENIN